MTNFIKQFHAQKSIPKIYQKLKLVRYENFQKHKKVRNTNTTKM